MHLSVSQLTLVNPTVKDSLIVQKKKIMQTKKQSFTEAISNTAIGFIISYISTFIIFPLVGFESSASINLIITVYFTIISIFRGYVIRRWFNNKQ